MKSNKRDELKQLYKDKILAIRNYEAAKDEFTVDDFLTESSLIDIIQEINVGESDITPAGKVFLKEYYGYDVIARIFVDKKLNLYTPEEKLKEGELVAYTWWLENMEPMEMAMFIARPSDSKRGGFTLEDLREELMPPKS